MEGIGTFLLVLYSKIQLVGRNVCKQIKTRKNLLKKAQPLTTVTKEGEI